MDNKSIAHIHWNCTYHIVFVPKYRRKMMYGETKKDIVDILKKLCEMKQVTLIEGRVCKDHVHMYLGIPPKLCISEVMAFLKGKSTLCFLIGIQNTDKNGATDTSGRGVIMLQQ